uniref:ATP-dependent DNA helicase n=1 Tax=Glycine max TaxID=3847 RepID=A0A0R0KEV8_SOYBN
MQNYQHANISNPANGSINSQARSSSSEMPPSGSNFLTAYEDCQSPTNQLVINTEGYSNLGDQLMQCRYCNAQMWYDEIISKNKNCGSPRFSLCCGDGKVELPLLQNPSQYLQQLLFDDNTIDSKNYQHNLRAYNMMFAFTSAGIKLDKTINDSRGPPTIRIQGQPCHRIGSLLPMPGKKPKFAQLYILDTENEVQNRINVMSQYSGIQGHIVSSLSHMLDERNAHAKSFRMVRDRLANDEADNIKLQLIATREKDGCVYNMPNVLEITALIFYRDSSGFLRERKMLQCEGYFSYLRHNIKIPNGENARNWVANVVFKFHNDPTVNESEIIIFSKTGSKRDIIVETQNGELQRIHELHPSYLSLQYPLLFPYGEDGYKADILHRSTSSSKKRKRNRLTMRECFAYRLQFKSNEAQTLLHSRKLFQQFIVEGYTMVESIRLSYIRNNQKKLRVDKYCSLQNSLDTGTAKGLTKGKRVILPSTFVGSPRYMDQLYFDGMAICSHVGFPNLFITLTCNPNCPEIRKLLSPLNLKPTDRPDIVSQIFRLKYEQMLSDLTKGQLLGKVVAYMHTIEFQKRGLPHVHLLLVQNHMIHGPCEILQPNSPCMKKGKCNRFYPKQFQPQTLLDSNGYPVYRRRNNGHSISKNGVIIDNRYIVPYNPKLLKKHQAHINIECCNQSTSIKYLFKYINKGYDRVTAVMVFNSNDTTQNVNIHNDELKEYLDCSLLLRDCIFIFQINTNKCFVEGRSLTYSQFVSKFVYNKTNKSWQLRKKKKGYAIRRLIWVPPTTGELFSLRMMLGSCKGPTSSEDTRTVANIQYATYREACFVMGFLQDDREYVEAIKEAKDWGTTNYLRKLFVLILLTGAMSKPEEVWNQCWHWLADDIAYRHSKSTMNSGRSLKDYPTMSYPQDINLTTYLENNLILSELDYNDDATRSEFKHLFASMTDEQKTICNRIIQAVNNNEGEMFFLYGFGGTRKIFIWRTLASSLRAGNQIVIIVASSGIASLLLLGGRSAHSRFKILHQWPTNFVLKHLIKLQSNLWRQSYIIQRGSRLDIINAKINSSYLWDSCEILTLTKNMRLHSNLESVDEQETATFAKWIRDIGDGIIGHENDGYATIEIHAHLLITEYDDPIGAIVKSTFPDLHQHHNNLQFFKSRTILASTNETVEQINDYALSFIPVNYLITYLILKIGSPIMLLRNLDQNQGLCNGIRLVVTRLAKHIIAVEIISGKNIGLSVYIPRMSMSPSQSP